MSGLTRRTRLKASREHDWEDEGRNEWRCTRCMARRWSPTEPDADVFPCSGLKRSGLQRNKRVNPVSETNRGLPTDSAFRGWVRGLACVSCGSAPPNDPHHRRSRGAGFGDWLPDGTGNLLPLCRVCHQTLHRKGVESFQYEQGINLEREAREIGERYQQEEAG